MSTPASIPRLRRLSLTVDVMLAISMILFATAAIFVGVLIVRWPPRGTAPSALHSGVQ